MATFFSGHQKIFWDLLLTSGLWGTTGRITPEEHTITIVSPWLTDVPTDGMGWPEELAKQACDSQGGMGSLSKVLSSLLDIGFSVRLIVLDQDSKWLEKKHKKLLKNECIFMENMEAKGAICQRRTDMHFKWACTPVGLWKGSSNSTANGLFGNLEEQNDLFVVSSELEEYNQQRERMEYNTQYSSDYFSGSVNITEMSIQLPLAIASQTQDISMTPESEIEPHSSLELGEYPLFIPSNYSPVGQIKIEHGNTLNQEETLSTYAWINQTVHRLVSLVDFVFSTTPYLLPDGHSRWTGWVTIKKSTGETITLSQSEKHIIENGQENPTTHEELFRIKDKFHVLQCCGITVNQNGNFRESGGIDASGVNLRPAYSEVLMRYLPVDSDVNEVRVSRLFSLVYNLVHLTCYIANSEDVPRHIAKELSNCILEIEANYLRVLEENY